jgi:hypothetical protein
LRRFCSCSPYACRCLTALVIFLAGEKFRRGGSGNSFSFGTDSIVYCERDLLLPPCAANWITACILKAHTHLLKPNLHMHRVPLPCCCFTLHCTATLCYMYIQNKQVFNNKISSLRQYDSFQGEVHRWAAAWNSDGPFRRSVWCREVSTYQIL